MRFVAAEPALAADGPRRPGRRMRPLRTKRNEGLCGCQQHEGPQLMGKSLGSEKTLRCNQGS
jgi:hypothetical protein